MIKQNWRIQDGAKNYFEMIRGLKRTLTSRDFKIVQDVFQNNSYFAHPEMVLLCAMFDKDLSFRQKALTYIICDRKRI